MLYTNTIGQGKDLVLLHGWGFNSDLFNSLVVRYKTQYRITVIDLPGHARSSSVAGGINEWCDAIIKILPKNPILLGWSLGGLLAINISHKIKVYQLILVASTPKFVQTEDWMFGIDKNNFKQFSQALQCNLSKGLKRFVSLQTDNEVQLKWMKRSIDALPASFDALNQGLEILLTSDLREPLQQLTIPVQVILGSYDTLIHDNIAYWYQQQNIAVKILKTGHLPFLHPAFELRII